MFSITKKTYLNTLNAQFLVNFIESFDFVKKCKSKA